MGHRILLIHTVFIHFSFLIYIVENKILVINDSIDRKNELWDVVFAFHIKTTERFSLVDTKGIFKFRIFDRYSINSKYGDDPLL